MGISHLDPLFSISPLDGRYHSKTQELSKYVSEFALIKTRVEVEIKYLLFFSQKKIIRNFNSSEKNILESIFEKFTHNDSLKVKEIEEETRHDVKAVERFIRLKLKKTTLKNIMEFIHFGLTSEDVNNISYRLLLKRGVEDVILPQFALLEKELQKVVKNYIDLPMIARTHGQSAVPTTLGKEFAVFSERLKKQLVILRKQNLSGKLNGAVGNYNALYFVYPKVNWINFSEIFILSLGLSPNLLTTQINTYEDIISYLQVIQRINGILLDLNQDIWRYISDNYFSQKFNKGEVGSSTMPQKVNPIDFENSEGNLGLANSLIEFMVRKLPVSRLQRDLTDSTVVRNLGVILGYELIALKSLLVGLSRIEVNKKEVNISLMKDWSILTEGVQTYLRSIGVSDSYSFIAKLSKGKRISEEEWAMWINSLPIEKKDKEHLKKLTPESYIGIAPDLARKYIKK